MREGEPYECVCKGRYKNYFEADLPKTLFKGKHGYVSLILMASDEECHSVPFFIPFLFFPFFMPALLSIELDMKLIMEMLPTIGLLRGLIREACDAVSSCCSPP